MNSQWPEVLNVRQCANYLGISIDALYKYIKTEQLPAFKLGNRWRFKKDLVDRWIANRSFHAN